MSSSWDRPPENFKKFAEHLDRAINRRWYEEVAGASFFCYNGLMKNWSVDEERFKIEDPEGYQVWRLEQLINFGLDGEKLNTGLLKKYWDRLSLDDAARRYLSFLLWPEKQPF